MTVQYLMDQKGKKTGVVVSIKDWEKIQKKLNTERFYEEFRESIREIKANKGNKSKLKDAKDLLNEL